MTASNKMENFTKVAVNSATDPGVLFTASNAVLLAPHDTTAMGLNIAISGTCFAIRTATELAELGTENPYLPSQAQAIIKNPGLSYAASGAVMIISAGVAARDIDMSAPETILPSAIMTCFGAAATLRGLATGYEFGSIRQRSMELAGTMAISAGLSLSNLDGPLLGTSPMQPLLAWPFV